MTNPTRIPLSELPPPQIPSSDEEWREWSKRLCRAKITATSVEVVVDEALFERWLAYTTRVDMRLPEPHIEDADRPHGQRAMTRAGYAETRTRILSAIARHAVLTIHGSAAFTYVAPPPDPLVAVG